MENKKSKSINKSKVRSCILKKLSRNLTCLSYAEKSEIIKDKNIAELYIEMVEVHEFLSLCLHENNFDFVLENKKDVIKSCIEKIDSFHNLIEELKLKNS